MSIQPYDIPPSGAIALSSDGFQYEFSAAQPNFLWTKIRAEVKSASSLTDAYLRLEELVVDDDGASVWEPCIQQCGLVSVSSGTPDVLNANTASTTAVAGGVSINTTGITDIDDNGVFYFFVMGGGKALRLAGDCTSGTASVYITGAGLVALG